MATEKETGFATRAIHAGQDPDPATGATIVPIYATSTYTQAAVGEHKGYEYSRSGNPTRTALETCLAALEGGERGLAFASGLAATTAVFSILRPGDEVAAAADLYGGTFRLLERVFKPWGLIARYTDDPTPAGFEKIVTPATKMVWIETPTNPLLQVLDIAALADVAPKHGAKLAVDNTFASPYLQRPIPLGADIVVHSTTKYLGGHSDVVGGAVVVRDQELHEQVRFVQNAIGAVPGPFDCFLVHRGLRTLHLRVAAHSENGRAVSEFLADAPGAHDVRWPGFGGMVSFRHADATRIAAATEIFTLAESLGGVESLIEVPQAMTHQSVEESDAAVAADLIRLSCGVEAAEDLVDDLARALG